jgi:hypothetical protein
MRCARLLIVNCFLPREKTQVCKYILMGLRKSHKQWTNGDKKRQVCRQGFDLALSCSVKDEAEAAGVAPAPEIRDRPESLRTSRGDVDFIMQ